MTTLVEIPIREEFDSSRGAFVNYDAYSSSQRTQALAQKHVDIRCFNQNNITTAYRMIDLDSFLMSGLDGFTMTTLESNVIVKHGEQWTVGTVAKQADRNNWRGISLSCVAGANPTQSVITQDYGVVTPIIETVDINAGFLDTDIISLALPAFPLASLTLASTFIDFTSNANGDFVAGPTDSIAFSQGQTTTNRILLSLGMGANLQAGDSELRFPRSLLTTVNKSAITGVRFRIQATGNCTFRCMAIRLLSANWKYAPVDINTRLGTLERPVSPSGAAAAQYFFPGNTIPGVPNDFPIMLRADDPPGNADPRPIDSHVSISFNSGSILTTGANIIRLFLRERTETPVTMLNLDSAPSQVTTQATLNALGHQPDYGTNKYGSRTQFSIDQEIQGVLDGVLQGDLERVINTQFASWLEAKLTWNNTTTTFSLVDQAGNGYTFTPTLVANTDYILFVDLTDNGFRARLFTLDSIGNVSSAPVFDTGTVVDDYLYKRRQGRIGWYAHFDDGDALVYAVRTRGFNFAEAKFTPMTSLTPVKGMSISAGFSPDRDLLTAVVAGPWGGQLVTDTNKSSSGHCFRITNLGLSTKQGIQTNAIYFEDWDNTLISFDLLFPSSASAAPLYAFLWGEFRVFSLDLGVVEPDSFQSYKLTIPAGTLQTGFYNVVFIQTAAGVNTVWWIDNLRIRQRAVTWEARGIKDDAWRDGALVSPFLPFRDALNIPDSTGVRFIPGTTPQVRARAVKQNTSISSVKMTPNYVDLGRLVWSDQAPVPSTGTASFSTATVGTTVTFTDTSTTALPVVASHWSFGDGNRDAGPVSAHKYASSGTYAVNHTVIDNQGNFFSNTSNVTV